MTASWRPARIIPVGGIDSVKEAESRATSALLAVLSVVRDLSIAVLSPFGASTARAATVEAFVEPPFNVSKKVSRPDGLVRVTYGTRSWTALVEVKTGRAEHEAEQINAYWDLARQEGFDCVITISNEIPPVPGAHPTDGLRVQRNSPVKVHHLSWTWLLATAVNLKSHAGIEDPEQAWILGELIRYLEHPASGALDFDDMGAHWVDIRAAARENRLSLRDEGIAEVVQRWDQLVRYLALTLGAEIGEDVQQVLSRKHSNPQARAAYLAQRLVQAGQVDGGLRIPNTAGDVELCADLRGQTVTATVRIDAPTDRSGAARGTWLRNQLPDASDKVFIEAYEKNARHPTRTTLARLREDRTAILVEGSRGEPARFVVGLTVDMGLNRRSGGKKPSFVDSVAALVQTFYGDVVQTITPWKPAPAKLPERPAPATEPTWDWWSSQSSAGA